MQETEPLQPAVKGEAPFRILLVDLATPLAAKTRMPTEEGTKAATHVSDEAEWFAAENASGAGQ